MSDIGSRRGAGSRVPIEPRVVVDSDGDGVSDVEEALAGTDPRVAAPPAALTPVLEASLPPIGAEAITAVIVPNPIEPEVDVAAPAGVVLDATLANATVTGTLDTSPSHYGIELDGRLAQPSIADALSIGGATGTSATVAPATSYGPGYLGALPGMSQVAAGPGSTVGTDDAGRKVTTTVTHGENENGKTTTTEVLTEGKDYWSMQTTHVTTKTNGDTEVVVEVETKEVERGVWVTTEHTVTSTTTNEDGEEIKETFQDLSDQTYDTGDDSGVVPATLSPVMGEIVLGHDPTTTTPSGPYVDDGGTDPITADAVSGGATTPGVPPVNPGVIDGGYEVDVVSGGDPTGRLEAMAPRTVNPNDPDFAGGEPITADDLNDPHPTNANPTSSTSNALTADGIGAPEPSTIAPVGGNAPAVPVGGLDPAVNPVADTGGEDEDLEDLEIQRLTPRAGALGMVAPGDAVTTPVISAATTPAVLAATSADPAINPIADSGGEDEDLEDLEIQRLSPRAGAVGMVAPDDALTNPAVAPFAATTVQPLAVDDVTAAALQVAPMVVTDVAPLDGTRLGSSGRGGGQQRGHENQPDGRGHHAEPVVPEVVTDVPTPFDDAPAAVLPSIDDVIDPDYDDDGIDD